LIQVGQVLDKYELLERVGQGGMAIVYRGLDRSLKRTVAIKILHKHLADYQEARDRFEREAQAVAKLRHENILEIFDYAAKEESEAYIVTEFIDGQTLKQFVTERPIAFPEIGAMIMLQVCRALAHAHAGGILHRDVKPENIMIRSDGVVKLMDFGISHMVDLERLTVTGQLLGSPAYMAPEHVEGRPLDFRTDVFAAGIVLYQLTVGKLPFEGKNPHEVLKRIAECKFVDPRQANPRIGNRLGRIILRAMAASPADRYAAIGEMVIALESYLEESGIASDRVAGELARYFQAPGSYEQALKERLVDHLTRRGSTLLEAGDQAPALDIFDRVLTIDPGNAKVLAILDGINRRARMKTAGLAALAIAALSGGGYMIHRRNLPGPPEPMRELPTAEAQLEVASQVTSHVEPPPRVALVAPPPTDAGPLVALHDAAVEVVVDAPPAEVSIDTQIRVSPAKDAQYRLGKDGPWMPVTGDAFTVKLAADTRVYVKNDGCCEANDMMVSPGQDAMIPMSFRPANIHLVCDVKGAIEKVDGKQALQESFSVPFGKSVIGTKTAKVEFVAEGVDPTPIMVTVEAGQTKEVACVKR
jgi:serine/threonine-protein kinase